MSLIRKKSYLCTAIYILIEKNGKELFATKRTGNRNGFSMIGYTQMDLGIAKYHFEVGAGTDNFEWV